MTVRDPRQVRLLTDAKSRAFFEPFLARERSVADAAGEVGCKLDTMLYRVGRFQEAGLLTVAREQPRAGRAIKLYRSVADGFFVPLSATPFADLEERLRAQLEPQWRRSARAIARWLRTYGWEGQRFYRDGQGVVWSESARDLSTQFDPEDPAAPALFDIHGEVALRPSEAKALQLELHRLWQRYRDKAEGRPGQRYLVQLSFVPLGPDD